MNTLYASGDERPRIWEITSDRILGYAKRHDASLRIIKPEVGLPKWFVLFECIKDSLNEEGNQCAWIDDDVIVGSHADSVWKHGMRIMVSEPRYPRTVNTRWVRLQKKLDVPNVRPYPCTGVVAWNSSDPNIINLVDWYEEFVSKGVIKNAEGQYEEWVRKRGRWGDQEVLAYAAWCINLPFFYFPSNLHSDRLSKKAQMLHAGGKRKISKLKRMERKMCQWEKK